MVMTLLFLVLALILAFRGAGKNGWSLLILGYLGGVSQVLQAATPTLIIIGIPAAAALLLINHRGLRCRVLITPFFTILKRALPQISATEQAAIDAGSVSWDGELLQPRPDWQRLFSYPKPELSPTERAFIDGPTEELCRMLDDWKITHEQQDLPLRIWRFLKRERFFGLIIAPEHGGLGFSALAHSTVVMKLSTRSISAAVTVMVPNSLGPAELLHRYGTATQCDYYLPRLAKGTEIPCFALTSPVAGSDAGAIEDRGVVCMGTWKNHQVLGFRLNWNKRYITLAPVATLIGLAFKAYDPDHLLGDTEELGITCALVPAATPGVVQGARHRPMNTVFMNGPTQGHDVFIPMAQIIGGEAYIGKGWSMLMNSLSVGRSISLPALSTGAGKLACLTSGAYARVREQFNTAIADFEGVQEALAPIAGMTYLMDCARLFTVNLVDQGQQPAVPSAILKYHNTAAMRQVINHAMDIHGGRGIMEGPRNYLARIYQAIPISITVEGANILTRSMMIFGQGAIRCHPYLLAEMQAVAQQDRRRGIATLDQLLCAHLRRNVQAAARSLVLGLGGSQLAAVSHPDPDIKRYLCALEQAAAGVVLVSDLVLASLGGQLKSREAISGRLGDCLSYLYLGSAIIKRFHDDGCPETQRSLLLWSLEHCLFNLQSALDQTLANLPNRWLGGLLRLWIYPLGRNQRPPGDQLNRTVAELITYPGTARSALTADVYLDLALTDPVGRVEGAFRLRMASQPLIDRLAHAQRQGVLSKGPLAPARIDEALTAKLVNVDESEQLKRLALAVSEAVQVDDYRPPTQRPRQRTEATAQTADRNKLA